MNREQANAIGIEHMTDELIDGSDRLLISSAGLRADVTRIGRATRTRTDGIVRQSTK